MKIDILKAQSEGLVEMMDDIQVKAERQDLTKQDFLQFVRDVKEKNSLVIEIIDEILETL